MQRKRDDLATSKIPPLLPLLIPIYPTILQRHIPFAIASVSSRYHHIDF
ncbi:MAG: hypothetical protein KME55_17635 [Nostoc indistinguendum CM1-VF10]|nr:hypothetical protein [Nostoc indistinguendum CM1-VF10]